MIDCLKVSKLSLKKDRALLSLVMRAMDDEKYDWLEQFLKLRLDLNRSFKGSSKNKKKRSLAQAIAEKKDPVLSGLLEVSRQSHVPKKSLQVVFKEALQDRLVSPAVESYTRVDRERKDVLGLILLKDFLRAIYVKDEPDILFYLDFLKKVPAKPKPRIAGGELFDWEDLEWLNRMSDWDFDWHGVPVKIKVRLAGILLWALAPDPSEVSNELSSWGFSIFLKLIENTKGFGSFKKGLSLSLNTWFDFNLGRDKEGLYALHRLLPKVSFERLMHHLMLQDDSQRAAHGLADGREHAGLSLEPGFSMSTVDEFLNDHVEPSVLDAGGGVVLKHLLLRHDSPSKAMLEAIAFFIDDEFRIPLYAHTQEREALYHWIHFAIKMRKFALLKYLYALHPSVTFREVSWCLFKRQAFHAAYTSPKRGSRLQGLLIDASLKDVIDEQEAREAFSKAAQVKDLNTAAKLASVFELSVSGEDIWTQYDVDAWLADAVSSGDVSKVESLKRLGLSVASEILDLDRGAVFVPMLEAVKRSDKGMVAALIDAGVSPLNFFQLHEELKGRTNLQLSRELTKVLKGLYDELKILSVLDSAEALLLTKELVCELDALSLSFLIAQRENVPLVFISEKQKARLLQALFEGTGKFLSPFDLLKAEKPFKEKVVRAMLFLFDSGAQYLPLMGKQNWMRLLRAWSKLGVELKHKPFVRYLVQLEKVRIERVDRFAKRAKVLLKAKTLFSKESKHDALHQQKRRLLKFLHRGLDFKKQTTGREQGKGKSISKKGKKRLEDTLIERLKTIIKSGIPLFDQSLRSDLFHRWIDFARRRGEERLVKSLRFWQEKAEDRERIEGLEEAQKRDQKLLARVFETGSREARFTKSKSLQLAVAGLVGASIDEKRRAAADLLELINEAAYTFPSVRRKDLPGLAASWLAVAVQLKEERLVRWLLMSVKEYERASLRKRLEAALQQFEESLNESDVQWLKSVSLETCSEEDITPCMSWPFGLDESDEGSTHSQMGDEAVENQELAVAPASLSDEPDQADCKALLIDLTRVSALELAVWQQDESMVRSLLDAMKARSESKEKKLLSLDFSWLQAVLQGEEGLARLITSRGASPKRALKRAGVSSKAQKLVVEALKLNPKLGSSDEVNELTDETVAGISLVPCRAMIDTNEVDSGAIREAHTALVDALLSGDKDQALSMYEEFEGSSVQPVLRAALWEYYFKNREADIEWIIERLSAEKIEGLGPISEARLALAARLFLGDAIGEGVTDRAIIQAYHYLFYVFGLAGNLAPQLFRRCYVRIVNMLGEVLAKTKASLRSSLKSKKHIQKAFKGLVRVTLKLNRGGQDLLKQLSRLNQKLAFRELLECFGELEGENDLSLTPEDQMYVSRLRATVSNLSGSNLLESLFFEETDRPDIILKSIVDLLKKGVKLNIPKDQQVQRKKKSFIPHTEWKEQFHRWIQVAITEGSVTALDAFYALDRELVFRRLAEACFLRDAFHQAYSLWNIEDLKELMRKQPLLKSLISKEEQKRVLLKAIEKQDEALYQGLLSIFGG